MNPQHDPLEAELEALAPRPPSPHLQQKIAESLAAAPVWPRTRRWRLVAAGGIAAAIVSAAFFWNNRRPVPPPEPRGAEQSLAGTPVSPPDDSFPTWQTCRQALAQSPEALEELLAKQPERRKPPVTVRAFARFDKDLFEGDQ